MPSFPVISAVFIKGAVKVSQFPELSVPEFAFFGRSNAGKSSLINMLLNRKNLVKTGARPGMTREINFFAVNCVAYPEDGKKAPDSKSGFCIADLPGYGYAKVPEATRNRIDTMLYDYCVHRSSLKMLFLLMDIRRSPSETEQQSLDFFHSYGIKTQLIATKADKLSKNEQLKQLKDWAAFFQCSTDSIIVTSASKKIGRPPLLACITEHR